VWAIGTDGDQAELDAPLLVSAMARADTAVELAIHAVHDGSFAGGRDIEFGVAQDAVELTGLDASVPAPIRAKLRFIVGRVRAGHISIPTALPRLSS
jgi:basic membrane protein A